MRTFQYCFAIALRLLAGPFVAVVVMTCTCMLLTLGDDTTTDADCLVGLWLHLPAFLLSATSLGAALEAWPLYSRGRSGEDLLLRLQPGPLNGCGAAALGTLAALTVSLMVAGTLFQWMLHRFDPALQPVHARISFFTAQPVLDALHPKVTLQSSANLAMSSLRLKPAGFVGSGDIKPALVRIRGDGTDLDESRLSMIGGEMTIELDPPRSLQQLSFERDPGSSVFVVFLPGSVWGNSDRTYGALANCLLAILSYLVPTALALAVMALGRRYLALPVGLAAGLATLGLSTLVELTPNNAAVLAFARGWWIPAEALSGPTIRSVAAVGLVLLLAYLIGKLRRT